MLEAEDKSGDATPILVHSDSSVVDDAGQLITPSYMIARRIKHRDNVIGPVKLYSGQSFKRLINFKKLELDLAAELTQASALEERLEALKIKKHAWLKSYVQEVITGNGLTAFKTALRSGVRKQGLIRNMIYLLLLLKGNYRIYLKK